MKLAIIILSITSIALFIRCFLGHEITFYQMSLLYAHCKIRKQKLIHINLSGTYYTDIIATCSSGQSLILTDKVREEN